MRAFSSLLICVLIFGSLTGHPQRPVQKSVPPTVALTPPMGWNSWNFFHGNVTDKDIRNAADQLVSTGMKDVGYVYVNIDDT